MRYLMEYIGACKQRLRLVCDCIKRDDNRHELTVCGAKQSLQVPVIQFGGGKPKTNAAGLWVVLILVAGMEVTEGFGFGVAFKTGEAGEVGGGDISRRFFMYDIGFYGL
jgi:hypothetical protein